MGTEFDPTFIQAPEHRPKATVVEAQGIPVIDLSARPIDDLAREIGCACRKWGFFKVINHGVPPEVRRKIESAAREFFARPQEEKMRVKRDEVRVLGYYDTELTKNVRDWKEVFDFTLEDPTFVPASVDPDDQRVTTWHNQWPDNPPVLREACEEYAREVEKLAMRLVQLIAISLGLQENRFNDFFKDQTSFMRLNHYPPCPNPDLALGVGRHKDGGALTILAEDDVGGLEVKKKSNGEWVRVKPTPDSFIINIGDIIQTLMSPPTTTSSSLRGLACSTPTVANSQARENLSLTPCTERMASMEQPPSTINGFGPRHYAEGMANMEQPSSTMNGQSKNDHSLFIRYKTSIFIALLIYVDDIIVATNSLEELQHFTSTLDSHFKLKDLGSLHFFLGLEIARCN
uniref:Fe2OG dioxygenase domain-containing protein n=1 Tax=Cannabis sativa TaxID=3483 RepID=A0A803QDA5_CANSA